MITKRQLVEITWGLAQGDERYISIRSDSEFKKKSLANNEWIYFKEIEISLRKVFEEMQSGNFSFNGDIVSAILSEEIDPQFHSSEYVLEKIKDCRENIQNLSNP